MELVNNVTELLTKLREVCPGPDYPKTETIETIKSLVGDTIRVQYEWEQKGSFQSLTRVILSSNRNTADFSRELSRECNGVVLGLPNWTLLSYPAPMARNTYRVADVIRSFGKYSIYEVKDGTVVTLYWYEPQQKWCMSSTNGYDVSNHTWMGPRTYSETLHLILQKYNFNFKNLNKSHCYCIGFRHHEFHPLLKDPQCAWIVQVCNVSDANTAAPRITLVSDEIGLPVQRPVVATTRDVFPAEDRSLIDYFKSIENAGEPHIHYGFVLRAADDNILVESKLLQRIRQIMYNIPYDKKKSSAGISSENRLNYVVLRAYLSKRDRNLFLNLFPQFIGKFKHYDSVFSKLANRIIALIRDKTSTSDSSLEDLAKKMTQNIESTHRLNVMEPATYNIIMDIITSSDYLEHYTDYLI